MNDLIASIVQNDLLIIILLVLPFIIMASIKWKKDKKRKPIKNNNLYEENTMEATSSETWLKTLFWGNQIFGFIITAIVIGLMWWFFSSIFSFIFLTSLVNLKYIGDVNVLKILVLIFVCSAIYNFINDKKKTSVKKKKNKK